MSFAAFFCSYKRRHHKYSIALGLDLLGTLSSFYMKKLNTQTYQIGSFSVHGGILFDQSEIP